MLHGQLKEDLDPWHEAGDLGEVGSGHHLRVNAKTVVVVSDLNQLHQLVEGFEGAL